MCALLAPYPPNTNLTHTHLTGGEARPAAAGPSFAMLPSPPNSPLPPPPAAGEAEAADGTRCRSPPSSSGGIWPFSGERAMTCWAYRSTWWRTYERRRIASTEGRSCAVQGGPGGGRTAATEGRSCVVRVGPHVGQGCVYCDRRVGRPSGSQGGGYLGHKGAGAGHNGRAYSAQGWQGMTGGGVVWSLSFVCPPPSLSLNPFPPHLGVLLEHAVHQIPERCRVPGGYRGILALKGGKGGKSGGWEKCGRQAVAWVKAQRSC